MQTASGSENVAITTNLNHVGLAWGWAVGGKGIEISGREAGTHTVWLYRTVNGLSLRVVWKIGGYGPGELRSPKTLGHLFVLSIVCYSKNILSPGKTCSGYGQKGKNVIKKKNKIKNKNKTLSG